jgi:hypothetical protein
MHSKALLKLNSFRFIYLFIGTGLLNACSYSVSLNNKVVYTPPSLFNNYQIADQRLAQCVEQTIVDHNINQAKELTTLNCSSANIHSLAGLEVFSGLEELNLATNELTQIEEIAQLSQLRILLLNNNPLHNVAPLLSLLQLHTLNLDGALELTCRDIQQLEKNWAELNNTLIKPEQCR